MQKITPCLLFDDQGEEAANFYVSIFEDSRIVSVTRYGEAGANASGRPLGSVMTVLFELMGQRFLALNGGSQFKFSEAISLMVNCESQQEIDYYWEKLSEGGDEKAQQCSWLKDRYGISWQIVPSMLGQILQENDPARLEGFMKAMIRMKKLDIAELKRAYEG